MKNDDVFPARRVLRRDDEEIRMVVGFIIDAYHHRKENMHDDHESARYAVIELYEDLPEWLEGDEGA